MQKSNFFERYCQKKQEENSEVVFESDWMDMVKTEDDYYFTSEKDGVCVLGFTTCPCEGLKFLGRFEPCPAHGREVKLSSLTGQIDKKDSNSLQTAVREFNEEAGIEIKPSDLISLGIVYPSKGSNKLVYCYAIDLSNIEIDQGEDVLKGLGDGSEYEKQSYCQWVTMEDIVNSSDCVLHTCLLRLMTKNEV